MTVDTAPITQRAPWHETIINTMCFMLSAWLGVVHTAAVFCVALLTTEARPFKNYGFMQSIDPAAQSMLLYAFAIVAGPSMVLWMVVEPTWRFPRIPKRPLKERLSVLVPECLLIIWFSLVHTIGVIFVARLMDDTNIIKNLFAALGNGHDLKMIIAPIAIVISPSIGLFMVARWNWLRLRAKTQD